MFVAAENLDLGTALEIIILKSLDSASAKIELQGEVAWCNARNTTDMTEKTYYVGVTFIALMKTQVDALRNFIDLYCKSACKERAKTRTK